MADEEPPPQGPPRDAREEANERLIQVRRALERQAEQRRADQRRLEQRLAEQEAELASLRARQSREHIRQAHDVVRASRREMQQQVFRW